MRGPRRYTTYRNVYTSRSISLKTSTDIHNPIRMRLFTSPVHVNSESKFLEKPSVLALLVPGKKHNELDCTFVNNFACIPLFEFLFNF